MGRQPECKYLTPTMMKFGLVLALVGSSFAAPQTANEVATRIVAVSDADADLLSAALSSADPDLLRVALTNPTEAGLLRTALTRGVNPDNLIIALTEAREDTLSTALTRADSELLFTALQNARGNLLATALQDADPAFL